MEYTDSSRGRIAQRDGAEEFYICGESCSRLNMHDWGATLAQSPRDGEIVMVQFKNSRREFFLNAGMLSLRAGDIVAVAANPGHDIGIVSLTGWLAKRRYTREGTPEQPTPPPLYRKATRNDLDKWLEMIGREYTTMLKARTIAADLGLSMKIADVEYQGDGAKASFYYSAEKRVDFRELVRILATEFKVRIEMRQIGPRQEAGRVGGIGTCGKELCCSRWMNRFASVTTSAVKMQDLTPNPQKQAGQCGKLKCCINFELETYEEAKRRVPRVKGPLKLEDCELFHVKNDLFREYMWFATQPKSTTNLIMLTVPQVESIIALNAKGQMGAPLATIKKPSEHELQQETIGYSNVIEEESITRFDNRKKRHKNRPKGKNRPAGKKP